ncbi:MAG: twin-arginine translocase TatA/TatE family subunit [Actinomycetota bacterium]
MPDIGVPELLIVLVVAFLLFGAKKLPELARSIGRSASEFKNGIREGGEDGPSPEEPPGPTSARTRSPSSPPGETPA